MKETRTTATFLYLILFFTLLSCMQAESHDASQKTSQGDAVATEVPVGVILDMGSWVGKTINSCISMAVSDFYALNSGYKTRITLHSRDSRGEPLQALSAALDHVKNSRVQAIIGPETFLEARFLAEFGEKAEVPILSFAPRISSSNVEYQFLVQIAQDETNQLEGIAKVAALFKWRDVILIYEDCDDGRRTVPYFIESFQDNNIRVLYRSSISPLVADEQILEEFHKLMNMQTTIFVVHASPSLASRIFSKAKELRMVTEGYAWIVTDWTMNLLKSIDSEVILESMQGVLGFKSHTPPSRELRNFTSRWMMNYHGRNPVEEVRGLNVFGIQAYDAIWALAKAIEKLKVVKTPQDGKQGNKKGSDFKKLANIGASKSGMNLLHQIREIRHKGLSGDFQLLINGRRDRMIYEIVNVIGNGEKRVGFWSMKDGIAKEIETKYPSLVNNLKAIVWPGDSGSPPKGWGKKLRIAVPTKAPFEEILKVVSLAENNATVVTGLSIDVFAAAIQALPYEVPYEYIPFFGTYNNLIDEVYLQNYDAAVGDVTITANRSIYVDFTLPYSDLGVATLVPIGNKNMWIFLKPLDADLWRTIVIFLFLTGFVIWVIEHPINHEFQGSPAQQIGTVIWFSFSTLVSAQREKLLSQLSRFVATVWILIVLILTSSYTAILSSVLTVQQIQLASKGQSIGYGGNAYVQGAVANNLNMESSMLRKYSTQEEFADALSRGRIGAVIDEIPYVKSFLRSHSADFAMTDSTQSITNGFGFVFQKGSPLASEISTQIARLREEGKLKVLENKWFKSQSSSMNQDAAATNEPRVLGLDSFRGLFLISGISSGLALLIVSSFVAKEKFNYILEIVTRGKLAVMMKRFLHRNTIRAQELDAT